MIDNSICISIDLGCLNCIHFVWQVRKGATILIKTYNCCSHCSILNVKSKCRTCRICSTKTASNLVKVPEELCVKKLSI